MAEKIKIRFWVKGIVRPRTKEYNKASSAKWLIEILQDEPTVRSIEVTNMAGEKMVWGPNPKTRRLEWSRDITA